MNHELAGAETALIVAEHEAEDYEEHCDDMEMDMAAMQTEKYALEVDTYIHTLVPSCYILGEQPRGGGGGGGGGG